MVFEEVSVYRILGIFDLAMVSSFLSLGLWQVIFDGTLSDTVDLEDCKGQRYQDVPCWNASCVGRSHLGRLKDTTTPFLHGGKTKSELLAACDIVMYFRSLSMIFMILNRVPWKAVMSFVETHWCILNDCSTRSEVSIILKKATASWGDFQDKLNVKNQGWPESFGVGLPCVSKKSCRKGNLKAAIIGDASSMASRRSMWTGWVRPSRWCTQWISRPCSFWSRAVKTGPGDESGKDMGRLTWEVGHEAWCKWTYFYKWSTFVNGRINWSTAHVVFHHHFRPSSWQAMPFCNMRDTMAAARWQKLEAVCLSKSSAPSPTRVTWSFEWA